MSNPGPETRLSLYVIVDHPANPASWDVAKWSATDKTLEMLEADQQIVDAIVASANDGQHRIFFQCRRYQASPERILCSGEVDRIEKSGDCFRVYFRSRLAHNAPPRVNWSIGRFYLAQPLPTDGGDDDGGSTGTSFKIVA